MCVFLTINIRLCCWAPSFLCRLCSRECCCIVLNWRPDWVQLKTFCFTQTHQETRPYWDPLRSFRLLFQFSPLDMPPALLFSFKLHLLPFIFSLHVSLYALFLFLSSGICLGIEKEGGVLVLSKIRQYLLDMLQLPNRFTPHLGSFLLWSVFSCFFVVSSIALCISLCSLWTSAVHSTSCLCIMCQWPAAVQALGCWLALRFSLITLETSTSEGFLCTPQRCNTF